MKYEWIIIGGGITGIAISEILTREGHQVLLIDRDQQLASETTKVFHEWIHTGSLYTLIPDKLITLKFLLGAIDDLLEYYSSFERMNLVPTESGLDIPDANGWFNPNYIQFKFRKRPLNLPWSYIAARSEYLIQQIKKHDWLRRRAGTIDEFKIDRKKRILQNLSNYFRHKNRFYAVECSDFTSNSRNILRDLIATAVENGLKTSLGNPVKSVTQQNDGYRVQCENDAFKADNVVLCAGKNIADFVDVDVRTSFAPIAIVKDLPSDAKSFVELDYYPKNCINLITKPDGIGMIGGISFNNTQKAEDYIEYVIKEHRKIYPGIKVIGSYLGEKNEIVFRNQERNYLFHIVPYNEGMWAVVPGKFTLGFSLAAEFYRRVYRKNPRKFFNPTTDNGKYTEYVSDATWYEMTNNKESTHGND